MVEQELWDLIRKIQKQGCEAQTIEVKAAHSGCPEKLYDTISSFSNQNTGGIFVFGLDERDSFRGVGVYNAQDLQKKVMEYCEQMTPAVRPVFTVCGEEPLVYVSAEIPPTDLAERPCYKTAKGRVNGSYIRVGDADKPMTEYEVYSYEAFRKKYRDDIRPVERGTVESLDPVRVNEYLARKRSERPHLSAVPEKQQYEFAGITRDGQITLTSLLLFGIYPQGYYPGLCIIASRVPGNEIGAVNASGMRFTDSKRIEGTIPEMLDGALSFVRNNMRISTKIDSGTGERTDVPEYPVDAVREAILNALIHRDYSFHTEGMPVQLTMYDNRLEIINPGGLYGRLTVDQLGIIQPDTRNPVLISSMETLGKTENRYSGIPTIRFAMKKLSLPEPVFADTRGSFQVILYHSAENEPADGKKAPEPVRKTNDEKNLLEFCKTPRTRAEIIQYLNISSGQYALRHYLDPLVSSGAILMTIPDKPRSTKQKYITAE